MLQNVLEYFREIKRRCKGEMRNVEECNVKEESVANKIKLK